MLGLYIRQTWVTLRIWHMGDKLLLTHCLLYALRGVDLPRFGGHQESTSLISPEGACRRELFLIVLQQYTPEFRRSADNLVLVEGLSTLSNDAYQNFLTMQTSLRCRMHSKPMYFFRNTTRE